MRVRILGVSCLLFVAIAPASARAATYCVHAAADPCTGEIDKGLNLSGALSDAAGSADNDTIAIRPGTYTGTSASPFNYLGTANSGTVRIVGSGAGPGGTVLKRDPGNIVTTAIIQGPEAISVEDLAVEVPNGSTGGQNRGLSLLGFTPADTPDHVADGVAITLPAVPIQGSGPLLGASIADATFRNSTVTGPVGASPTMTGVSGTGADLVEDSTINVETAVRMQGGGTARRIDATAETGFLIRSENTGTGFFTVEDSLWRPPPGITNGRGLDAACGALSLNVTLRNATFVNPPNSGTDAIAVCPSGTAVVDIHSSILSGGFQSLIPGNGSTVAVSYSDFDPAKVQVQGSGTLQTGPGNVNVAPGFAGANDFRLASDSPLLDQGDPAALVEEESTTDLDGLPRVVDAFPLLCPDSPRRDMGAYEFQPPDPPCGTTPPIDPVPPKPLTCHGLTPTITGTEASETIIGTNGADVIAALGGDDRVKGALGKDVICGGNGKDVLKGGAGTDELYGEEGRDKLSGGGSEGDLCNGGASKDTANASCEKGPDS